MLQMFLKYTGVSGKYLLLLLIVFGSMMGSHSLVESVVNLMDGGCITLADADVCVNRTPVPVER